MLEGLYALGRSLAAFFGFWPIVYALGATLVGILVGCMPGLSATLAIALLTTLTIKMAPADAILILICAYVGAIYGGSRTAILLNIPGTAANAAACLDGYQLARKARLGARWASPPAARWPARCSASSASRC
jgi:putative tricarboxylic transport membrane protein